MYHEKLRNSYHERVLFENPPWLSSSFPNQNPFPQLSSNKLGLASNLREGISSHNVVLLFSFIMSFARLVSAFWPLLLLLTASDQCFSLEQRLPKSAVSGLRRSNAINRSDRCCENSIRVRNGRARQSNISKMVLLDKDVIEKIRELQTNMSFGQKEETSGEVRPFPIDEPMRPSKKGMRGFRSKKEAQKKGGIGKGLKLPKIASKKGAKGIKGDQTMIPFDFTNCDSFSNHWYV